MQYNLNWEETKIGGPQQSPENDAFINAENEVYLRKVAHSLDVLRICSFS